MKEKIFGTGPMYPGGMKFNIELASKAGFKSLDYYTCEKFDSIAEEEKAFKELKKIADDNGMFFYQIHAEAITQSGTPVSVFKSKEFFETQKEAIRRAAILGAKYIAYHGFVPWPNDFKNVPYDYSKMQKENFEVNVEVFGKLKDDLVAYDKVLCLEDLNAYDFTTREAAFSICCSSKECNDFIDVLGDDRYGICFDCGHKNLVGGESLIEFIRNVGKRIKIIHMHDNFGIQNDWFGELDRHLPPFWGSLKWDEVANGLEEIGFDGVYNFEVHGNGLKEFAKEGYEYLYKAADLIFNKKVWKKY